MRHATTPDPCGSRRAGGAEVADTTPTAQCEMAAIPWPVRTAGRKQDLFWKSISSSEFAVPPIDVSNDLVLELLRRRGR